MAAPVSRLSPLDPAAPEGDAELIAALKRGDEAAFERLVRGQTPTLLAVARRMLRNEDDAREAVQDAFLSAFKAIAGFSGDSKLSTWLHRITVNAALMKLRTRRRHPETSLETAFDQLLPRFQMDGHAAESSEPWEEPVNDLVARQETREIVRKLIDQMPETYRTVLLLRDIEELSTDETARLLEATPNAIKIRLHRARQALRAKLDQRFRMSPK